MVCDDRLDLSIPGYVKEKRCCDCYHRDAAVCLPNRPMRHLRFQDLETFHPPKQHKDMSLRPDPGCTCQVESLPARYVIHSVPRASAVVWVNTTEKRAGFV
ncbi:hypothetical protein ZHAS_00004801 [Anopheles sinensis]|uniref:Uncharacterized protein n=1 Tax=Anopheles sinensis TaxID=74873 RepID=A0A084VHX1_ANOSI|nr:hypothetical protein ZHAS_00004801 [Anopheles sinensis]